MEIKETKQKKRKQRNYLAYLPPQQQLFDRSLQIVSHLRTDDIKSGKQTYCSPTAPQISTHFSKHLFSLVPLCSLRLFIDSQQFSYQFGDHMDQLLSAELAWAARHFEFDQLLNNELVDLEKPLLPHDVFKLDKILDDIAGYLAQISKKLHPTQIGGRDDMLWFYEGRNSVIEVLGLMTSIDLFVSSVLLVPLILKNGVIALKLKRTSQLLVDARQALLTTKRRIDIAANYNEVKHQIIDALEAEVGNRFNEYKHLQGLKFRTSLPEFLELEQVTAKMRLNYLTPGSFSMKSVALPAFSDEEASLYHNFELFEEKLDPINVSMEFLEHRVREFNHLCGTFFPGAIVELNSVYDRLRQHWQLLLAGFLALKKQAVDLRWSTLFAYLIEDVLVRILNLIVELKEDQHRTNQISDHLGTSFKLCSNTITLIHKAFLENVIYDKNLTAKFNDTLLPRWTELNELLVNERSVKQLSTPKQQFPELAEDGLRLVKMVQKRTPLVEVREITPATSASPAGLGIDLHLDVNPSPSVPFSISKTDRIVDLNIDADLLPKSNIRMALLALHQSEEELAHDLSDTETLVHAVEEKKISPYLYLRTQHLKTSRIPMIVSNYTKLRLPVIKKMFIHGYTPTKILSISPSHPVFDSPERRSLLGSPARFATRAAASPQKEPLLRPESPVLALRSPPVFNLARTPRVGSRISSDGSIKEEVFVSRSTSLQKKAEEMSLVGLATPNLAYGVLLARDPIPDGREISPEVFTSPDFRSPSFRSPGFRSPDRILPSPDRASLRSSSPERPQSSLGSRYDDLHLTHPIKFSKSGWR